MIGVKSKLLGALMLYAVAGFAQVTSLPRSLDRTSASKALPKSSANRGQQVFTQNCSRCHNAPERIPQQVSGTIAKHMRVRAKLSGEDYRALLEFLEK